MYILFDIGGTKTRMASATTPDAFTEPVIFDTPQNYAEGIIFLKEQIATLSHGDTIEGIIGGIAGPWSKTAGMMVSSQNLPDWANKPLKADLEEAFNTRVLIDNDAAMVGLGEAVFGAGVGFSIVAYITVSTGVGGARIVDGKVDERSTSFEPGKQIIDEHGDTLENLISGAAVAEKTGKPASEITDHAFWDSLAMTLAVGLNNIIVTWTPDIVVLGGSMMNTVGIPIETTERHLHTLLKVFPVIPPLKYASLGDLGGLYGGLAVMRTLK